MQENKPPLLFGIHALKTLLKSAPGRVVTLYVARKDARVESLVHMAQAAKISVEFKDRHWLDHHIEGKHQGVAAEVISADAVAMSLEEILQRLNGIHPPALLLALDGIQDPRNLGACLRVADGAGALAVIAPKDRASPLTPVAQKAASGAAVPFIAVTNLARALEQCKKQGLWIVGTDDDAKNSLYQQDLKLPTVWVVGAEGAGLRQLTKNCCDFMVHIPMMGVVESLNVSVAASLCLFESRRQQMVFAEGR